MSSPLLVEDDTRLASHQRHTECIVKTFVVIRRKGSRSLQWPMCQLSYIETNRPWATGVHTVHMPQTQPCIRKMGLMVVMVMVIIMTMMLMVLLMMMVMMMILTMLVTKLSESCMTENRFVTREFSL